MQERDTLQELKQKEYYKLIFHVPANKLASLFQACQDVGLVGEDVQYVLSSLDFHGTNYTYDGFSFDHILRNKFLRREIPDSLVWK